MRNERTPFAPEAVEAFLKTGWILAMNSEEIAVGWGEGVWSSHSLHGESHCSLYAPAFYLTAAKPWLIAPYWDLLPREKFLEVLEDAPSELKAKQFQWVDPSLDQFSKRFLSIREGFEKRGLRKGVPVVFAYAKGSFGEAERLSALQSLMKQPGSLLPHGVWGSGPEGLLGATPEVLFTKFSDGRLETMALAGTKAKSESAFGGMELLNDPKERFEHQIVVDDIRSQLSALGDVSVGETRAAELPTLFHLKTLIQAKVNGEVSFSQLASLLHPTPALGVSPRSMGFVEMRNWDDAQERARYGAPFGVLLGRHMHCVVAIRNIQWRENDIFLGTGCGVVSESVLEREWNELRVKRDSVKRLMGL